MWPGLHQSLGRHLGSEATNFAVFSPEATRSGCASSTTTARETRHQLTEHTLGRLARRDPRRPGRPALRLPRRRPVGCPSSGRRFNPAQAAPRPVRPRDQRQRHRPRRAAVRTTPPTRDLPQHDSTRLRACRSAWSCTTTSTGATTGRCATRWRDTVIYELHVKGFTQLHDAGARAPARHLRRPRLADRSSPTCATSASPPSSCCRCTSSSTSARVAARGLTNYWGYNSDRLLRPARAVQLQRRPRPAGHRVQADGEDASTRPASRSSSTSSTTTPPRAGPTDRRTPSAGSTTTASTSAPHGRQDAYWDITGCGNTVDSDEPRRPAAHPRLAALLGDRDARRRLPLRPRVGAGPHRARRRHGSSAFLDDDQPGPGAARRQADRRAVGREHGRLPRRVLPAAVGGVERPLPRHDARLLARPARSGVRDVASRLAGSSDLYADDGRSPYASVNFVTAHDGFTLRDLVSYDEQAQRGQRRGQPRRHRPQPLVEPRRRGRDRRRGDRRAAAPAGREPDGDAVPVQRRPDDHRRRRARPHPARQQQRLLPGQRDLLGRLASRRRVARHLRDHEDRAAAAPRAPRAAAAPPLPRPPDDRGRPQGPRLDPPRRPRDDRARLVRRPACTSSGMFVSGDPLRSPGPHGEQLRDKSFLLWLNASGERRATSPARERLGRHRRGRAQHRPGPPRRRQVRRGRAARSRLAARTCSLRGSTGSRASRAPAP